MKKISRTFIPSLALILAVLTSCEPDSVSGGLLSSGKPLSFTIGNGSVSSTRGTESRPEVPASSLLCTLESAEEDGDAPTLSITQTVSSLDDEWLLTAEADGAASVTRGMPVFTENLGTFAATTYAALTSTTGTTVYNDVWSNMKDAEFTKGTGNVWSHEYTNNERWPENGNLTFFMRYPVTATNATNLSGLEYARVNGKNVINLASYSTPGAANTTTAAEAQTDIVFATATLNEGNKSTNNRLLFYHPLCGVKFKIGTLPTGVSITGITLEGVYATGDCVITPYYGNTAIWNKTNSNSDGADATKSAACVAWSNLSTASTFGQTFTSSDYNPTLDTSKFPTDFADAGTNTKPNQNQLNTTTLSKTFNLIPQTFSSGHKLTIILNCTENSTTTQRTVEVDGIEWKAGHLYTYDINYSTFTFEVIPSETLDLDKIHHSGDNGSFSVVSYKTINKSEGPVNTPVAWTAQYSTDGGTSWNTTSPDMLKSFSSLAGSGSLTGEEVNFEIAMQSIYNLPESMNTRILAMQATTVGSADNYVDVRTLADNNIGNATATANCYLVGHPGYYKLPLVYGNALKDDGSVSIVRPYNYDYGTGNPNYGDLLPAPVDHNDNVIDNAYIYNKYTPADCVLLWQDEPKVIKNVHLSDDKHWLLFEVDHDHIMQCNAIVSVRDASGIIMWSWHIWVTDQTLADNTAQVNCIRNTGAGHYEFTRYLLQYPLGWCTGKETHYGSENRSMKVRFVQEDSGDEEVFTINQLDTLYKYDDNCLFYEFGRPTPEPGTVGFTYNVDKTTYTEKSVYTENGTYHYKVRGGKAGDGQVSVGTAIRNPDIHYAYDPKVTGQDDINLNWADQGWGGRWGQHNDNNPFANTPKTIYDPSPVGYMILNPHVIQYYENNPNQWEWVVNGEDPRIHLKAEGGKYITWPTGERDPLTGMIILTGDEGRIWCSGAYYNNLAFNGFCSRRLYMMPGQTDRTFGLGWNCTAQSLYVLPMKEPTDTH